MKLILGIIIGAIGLVSAAFLWPSNAGIAFLLIIVTLCSIFEILRGRVFSLYGIFATLIVLLSAYLIFFGHRIPS